ncbi:MAG: TfoX/Sxy family DNA transformation protein [Gemmataceae bacterium]
MSAPIESLRNLGLASTAWLRSVGVATVDDLKHLGLVVAYRLVKQHQPRASLNLLWSLAAGLADQDWRELSEAEMLRLRRELEED